MILVNYFSFHVLSSARAYINVESHYARSHKNASRNLLLYIYLQDPAYYKKFEKHINVPIQNGTARTMLVQNKDKLSIKKILLEAGNTEETVQDFLWAGRNVYYLPFLNLALSQCKASDILVQQLNNLGLQINAESKVRSLSDNEKLFFAKKIDNISEKLIIREVNFSKILNAGIKNFNLWIYITDAIIILVLFSSSILKSGLLINSLAQTKNELELKNQLLTTTNEELDKFVYSASHDLRAPLASLKGLLILANEEKDMGEIKYYFTLMIETIEKQDKFILDIIDYSRNKKTVTVEQIAQLEEIVDESIAQHIYYYKDHAIQIKKDMAVKEVFTDPTRLKMILNNLISNAVKYRDPDKPVTIIKILSYKTDENICIDVIDNGIGIKNNELDKVFNMFFVSEHNHIGIGLGLYIAKESIQKLGGFITVNSHLGMGTKFTICLPITHQFNMRMVN